MISPKIMASSYGGSNQEIDEPTSDYGTEDDSRYETISHRPMNIDESSHSITEFTP